MSKEFQNPHITQEDVIYFVMTDRFYGKNKNHNEDYVKDEKVHGGTLDGILSKLEYLKELGVTAIWVTPIYKNIEYKPDSRDSEPYHYYWPSDFEKIDRRLLDKDSSLLQPTSSEVDTTTDYYIFDEFVKRCNSQGFKVILDMVVNHTGYGMKDKFKDPSWFHHGGTGDEDRDLLGLPDFDQHNPEVVDYFINNIKSWIEKAHVANIRMDTVKNVDPRFWNYFKSQIRGQHPDTFLVGEVFAKEKDKTGELAAYQNYHDFDSIFDFPLYTAIRSALIGNGSLSYWLARPRLNSDEPLGVLDNDDPSKGGYRNPNSMATILDNHDLDQRIMSDARSKHPGDDDGVTWAIQVTKLCLGALFTMRGIPTLYYGTEVGLEGWRNGGDCDLRRDFPWNVIDDHTHHPKDEVKYHKESEIYEWTRDLITLRKGNEAFRYGTTVTLWSDHFVYAFLRISASDAALAIINNGYLAMPNTIKLLLNSSVIPKRVIDMFEHGKLKHWRSEEKLKVVNREVEVKVAGKTIDIYCTKSVADLDLKYKKK